MAIETFQNEIFPDSAISVALFESVANCNDLKKLAMTGELDATLLNPSMIVDTFQILVACNKALHLDRCKKRVTRTLHSEVIYNLSPSKNISDAFRKFGMGDKDTSVLLVQIHSLRKGTLSEVAEHVQGEMVDLSRLQEVSDVNKIKKIYKVQEAELRVSTLLDAIVSRMTSKEFVSF
ncbi:hypothetical protein NP493_1318g00010 [Ridgeia piscesae]|uniref:EKC/KEOPS complex subunit CGI121 n=1 Tax=Ridgeia piscesae TaxID=27915 RepID=A0AAD9NDQ5_RIDPI|nr:hypothetical protein NP493_1318g00010 [Ridgeia piscesae]